MSIQPSTGDMSSSFDAAARERLDAVLSGLHRLRQKWAELPVRSRIELLQESLECVQASAADWVQSGLNAKGVRPDSPAAAEEWLTGPYLVARNMRLLQRSLEDIEQFGHPRLPGKAFARHERTIAPVFPTDWYDAIMFSGYRAEVWMQPHVDLETLPDHMAVAYRQSSPTGRVCAVLGAGNVSSIGPMDALYKLFVENAVVCLKLHPQNEHLAQAWQRSLQPLVRFGSLAIVRGGGDAGSYLVNHDLVDEVHLTGSSATHDSIVFGEGPEAAERKQRGEPLLQKKVTSELGNVSAMIVVPGRWRKADVARQAENIASSLVNNAGFNCNATRVLMTHRQWPQRGELLDAVRSVLSRVPPRRAYYHGAAERYGRFQAIHPEMETLGNSRDTADLAWGFIPNLDPQHVDEICFRDEPFCGLMSETSLEAATVASFLDQAVRMVNDRLFGSLNASILISPDSRREREVGLAFERAVRELRVGTVAVNHWAALGYALCSTTWGAFPGHAARDIQSGQGVVHNTYMFDAPEKSVVYGPFRPWPKPAWFATHRRANKLGPRLVDFECRPSVLKLPQIFRYACEL